jgi:uncharacterized protein (TIGR02270 family)
MTAERPSFVPDILEEHLEELGFLWWQRQLALRHPSYTIREFSDLEERIQAHLQGIMVVGDGALPLLEESLSSDDDQSALAAASALLHFRASVSASRVLDTFATSSGHRLVALRQALCHAPLDHLQARIEDLFRAAPTPIAAAAAEILTFHSLVAATVPDIERFLVDDDTDVRRNGWRLVGYLGLSLDAKPYASAMRDEPTVRGAALEAGAWCGEHGILAMGRKQAENPTPDFFDALHMLAVLGGPDDLPRMTAVGGAAELGPERFQLLAAYGDPALMNLILEGIADSDPGTAAAAGAAFTKMTGFHIDSDDRTTLPPSDGIEPDEFDKEFLDEVMLPSVEKAQEHWESERASLSGAARLCKGFDLGAGLNREQFAALDMESRWEVCLRGRYSGAWDGSPLSLEIFPQRR